MNLDSTYELSLEDVAERSVSGTTLLVPIKAGAAASGIFELNPMAAKIWEMVKVHSRVQAVCDVLANEIEGSDDGVVDDPDGEVVPFSLSEFHSDVLAVVTKLSEIGAIKPV